MLALLQKRAPGVSTLPFQNNLAGGLGTKQLTPEASLLLPLFIFCCGLWIFYYHEFVIVVANCVAADNLNTHFGWCN